MTEIPDSKFVKDMKKEELKTELLKVIEDIQKLNSSIEKSNIILTTLENIAVQSETIQKSIEALEGNILEKQKSIATSLTDVQKIRDEAATSRDEIDSFHNNLFGENDDKNISTQIQNKATQLEQLFSNHSMESKKLLENSETKFHELFKKIESLLPSATSAGLASSFREAQKRYHPLEGGSFKERFFSIFHSSRILWFGFISTILGLSYLYYLVWKQNPERFHATSVWNLFTNIAMGFPLMWLAWFFQRSISQGNRLFEEYNHKSRVMNLYEGFVRVIDEAGLQENKKELLGIMLQTVNSNPSQNLGKNETFLESVFSKILELRHPGTTEKTNTTQG